MFTTRAYLVNNNIFFTSEPPFQRDSNLVYIVLVTFIGKEEIATIENMDETTAGLGEYHQELFGNLSQEDLAKKIASSEIGLSKREIEVLKLIQQGLTNEEIAEKLELGGGTIRNYTSSIYEKLKVPNRTSAISKAIELGLL